MGARKSGAREGDSRVSLARSIFSGAHDFQAPVLQAALSIVPHEAVVSSSTTRLCHYSSSLQAALYIYLFIYLFINLFTYLLRQNNRDFKIQRRGRRRERKKKNNRFYKQNNSFARALHFFCTFLSRFCTTTT